MVSFKEPFVPFLNYAASAWNHVVPREIYDQDGHYKDRILGSGPFQLDEKGSQKGSRWVFKKNPANWDQGNVYLDEIRWLVLPDESTSFAAFQAQQLDILEDLAFNAFTDVSRSNPQAVSYQYTQPRGYFVYLSQARGRPLTDVRVRRAIGLAIDRDAISRVVAGGKGTWSLPGAMPGMFSEAETKSLMKQDLVEARRLLAEAGYPNGVQLKVLTQADGSAADLAWVQLVQAQLRQIGIEVALDPADKATVSGRKRKGDYDLDYSVSLGQLEADIDSMVYAFRSGTGLNWSQINDPQLDAILDAQRRELDAEKRRDLLRQVATRMVDQAWGISLIFPPKWAVWQPHVKNYRPNFGEKVQYPHAWVAK